MRIRLLEAIVAVSVVASLVPAVSPAAPVCMPDPAGLAAELSGTGPFTEDPEAGWWRTWTVAASSITVQPPPLSSSTETAGELAELQLNQVRRTPEQLGAVARWDTGGASDPWTRVFLDVITMNSTRPDKNPPRIARDIALVQTAMFDALVATWKAKICYRRPAPWALDPALAPAAQRRYAPSYPSEHATVAGVMKVMMPALYGHSVDVLVAEATTSRIWGGANYRSDLTAGLAIGAAVANAVLASRADDGSSDVWNGSGVISGTCNWVPTPSAFRPPLEPLWGNVRPWVMSSGSQFRPAPPPECDALEYLAAQRELYEMSLHLSPRQKDVASYWGGGPGTATPPGMNLRTALDATSRRGLSTMRESRVLAHVGATLSDAAIAAWDAKFTYWSDRPVIAIRRLFDASWMPFLTTPPFPGYVSGHATFSGAAMRVLAGFFPDDAVAFHAMATEAAMSRFYGGIHPIYDNEVGLDLGMKIGDLALARALADGAA